MSKITYIEKSFQAKSLVLIEKANEIIDNYRGQGYDLTLRQLYYQFVARALIPNSEKSYKQIGSLINDGRLAGLIDWESIVDRTRELKRMPHWETPEDIIDSCVNSFRIDKWANQPNRVEVWIEKEALPESLNHAVPPWTWIILAAGGTLASLNSGGRRCGYPITPYVGRTFISSTLATTIQAGSI